MEIFKIFGSLALNGQEQFNSGIDTATQKGSTLATKLTKGFMAIAKVGGAALAAVGTGIAALSKLSVAGYAEYEQLVGGVETLFKDSSAAVQQYAQNAYKTAGLSANEYMATVTSFSASLLQSLGGDTAAAAEMADLAITDMSDNANKMGTDMAAIQNAYNGFAKQNYTMLDNLKLGYGGTKEEMQRLIDDANALNAAQGNLTEYSIENYADIVSAIHDVQTEMGITGTTAKEASSTIQGSIATMKGAWQNFITGLANENADLGQLTGNLVDSVVAVGNNIIPRIQILLPRIAEGLTALALSVSQQLPEIMQTVVPSLLSAAVSLVMSLVQGITDTLPMLTPVAAEGILTITTGLLSMLPKIIQAGFDIIAELASGLAESLPTLIPAIVSILLEIVATLTDPGNLTMLINVAIDLIMALANGLIAALPQLIAQAPVIISNLVTAIIQNVPKLILAAYEIIVSLIRGIAENLGQVGEAAGDIIQTLFDGIEKLWADLIGIGSQIVDKIKEGISAAWDGLVSFFTGLWDSLFGNRTVNVGVSTSGGDGGGGVDGSHARGLDFVPFDGYVAELHKGEMVVPAAEARAIRSGYSGTQNGEMESLLKQILTAIEDSNRKETVLKINNREFGRAVRGAVYA